ncbi:putative alpha-1,3-glucanase [Sordaria brevicollis]|uniref:Alpha-1,3-glucanase n=1 Tax=Sordaria brevicollis TaxID=83679 RepID=A0AAE0U2H7_SORBR|nr:putative alpha-1,3-glucanase [Sordaria brevicollis]
MGPLRFLVGLASCLASFASVAQAAEPKTVFAHFMVGNTKNFTVYDWATNIDLAKSAGIDAFALNMANNESTTYTQLPVAFHVAAKKNFKLFFSFDYAGNGPWSKDVVKHLLASYGPKKEYFKRGSQPLVSTFEGVGNAADWIEIKAATNAFFIPDWSSVGAFGAIGLANGVADGLFSWDAWPKADQDMTTYPDASYLDALKGKPYMMPVSPWFYTNLPGYGKNWLWRGDDLWYDRWQQIISIDSPPDYVQIISWNDFGESHYIGPLDNKQYEAFDMNHGRAPFNYVKNMPHDGWRAFLPFVISLFKTGTASFRQEGITAWYRPNPNGACNNGGTTGNTATQLQYEYPPEAITKDRIFYSALLGNATGVKVQVSINGHLQPTTDFDSDGKPFGVLIKLLRGRHHILATIRGGAPITTSCTPSLLTGIPTQNFNAWVGSALSPPSSYKPHTVSLPPSSSCISGTGIYDFTNLCSFSCHNGYCPSSACICHQKGLPSPPPSSNITGYPAPGESVIYTGLCSFACAHGYCPQPPCTTIPNDNVTIPDFSPFNPPACVGGEVRGGVSEAFTGLCAFGCGFGFCPIAVCECTGKGRLVDAPEYVEGVEGYFKGEGEGEEVDDHGLCNFAVTHGYLPGVCGTRLQTWMVRSAAAMIPSLSWGKLMSEELKS